MSLSDPSQSRALRSKRIPMSSSSKSKCENPKPSSLSLNTPEKAQERARNRGVALSVKDVRQAAQSRPSLKDQTVGNKSARKQILSWPSDSSPLKPRNTKTELAEKYETLSEFFDGLDSAIRLLKLRGIMPIFSNIYPSIERLTDRRFSHAHLAQLKHVLPEAIEIKRVLTCDERTSCMKPDLHVALNASALDSEGKREDPPLRKVFRARLVDFVKAHPKGDDVPEELLPEPFNRPKQNLHSNIAGNSSSGGIIINLNEQSSVPCASAESQDDTGSEQPVATVSHLPRRSRRPYKISPNERTINATGLFQTAMPTEPPSSKKGPPRLYSQAESHSMGLPSTPIKDSLPKDAASTPSRFISTPAKSISTPAKCISTPAKLASTPARLMSATPAPQPPKRCCMSPDDDSSNHPNKLVRRPPRSLKFDSLVEKGTEDANIVDEDEAAEVGNSAVKMGGVSMNDEDDDILSILPESLLESIKAKEKRAMEDRDPAISLAKRRQKMIARLPKLFNTIHFLFQSSGRQVITKRELIHKVISGHCDIADNGEVEEQLDLMLELVPDWISEKQSVSGDRLVRINRMSSAETIRARLEEESRRGVAAFS